jgi:phosphoribosylglycinamide formyltransferase-1
VKKVNLAIFASGSGSNAEAIIHYSHRLDSAYRVALVVSNNSQCLALQRAMMFDIPTLHISSVTHPEPRDFAQSVLASLRDHHTDLIALAGYMKHLPGEVIEAFSTAKPAAARVFNIHPSLLPKFGGQGMYGLNVHKAVLASGERESGLTIHEVTPEYDKGTILHQHRVAVLPDDTPETLAARINLWECELYPAVLHTQAELLRTMRTTNDSSRV